MNKAALKGYRSTNNFALQHSLSYLEDKAAKGSGRDPQLEKAIGFIKDRLENPKKLFDFESYETVTAALGEKGLKFVAGQYEKLGKAFSDALVRHNTGER